MHVVAATHVGKRGIALQRACHSILPNFVHLTPDMQGSPVHVVQVHMLDNDACSLKTSPQDAQEQRYAASAAILKQPCGKRPAGGPTYDMQCDQVMQGSS